MSDITLQQIEMFLKVAEHLSFSKAAKVLYISQPALSKIIGRLENGLGVTLFTRKSAGIELTLEGERLYDELHPLFQKISRAIDDVRSMAHKPEKHLRLACHTSFDAIRDESVFMEIVRKYSKAYPDVSVTEELHEFRELRNSLLSGDVDVIYTVNFAIENLKEVTCKKLDKQKFYFIMSNAHRLAAYEELPISELNDEVFYFVYPSYTNETEYERCRQMGFTPKAIEHLPNFPSVVAAVRQGKGLSFVGNIPTSMGVSDIKHFTAPEIDDLPYLIVAWRIDNMSKEVHDFVDMLPGIPE